MNQAVDGDGSDRQSPEKMDEREPGGHSDCGEYLEMMGDGTIDLDSDEITAYIKSGCETVDYDNNGCEVIVSDGIADLINLPDLSDGEPTSELAAGINMNQMDSIFMNAMDEISKFNPCKDSSQEMHDQSDSDLANDLNIDSMEHFQMEPEISPVHGAGNMENDLSDVETHAAVNEEDKTTNSGNEEINTTPVGEIGSIKDNPEFDKCDKIDEDLHKDKDVDTFKEADFERMKTNVDKDADTLKEADFESMKTNVENDSDVNRGNELLISEVNKTVSGSDPHNDTVNRQEPTSDSFLTLTAVNVKKESIVGSCIFESTKANADSGSKADLIENTSDVHRTVTESDRHKDSINEQTSIFKVKQETRVGSCIFEPSPTKHSNTATENYANVSIKSELNQENYDESDTLKSTPPSQTNRRRRRHVPYTVLSFQGPQNVVIARNNIQNMTIHGAPYGQVYPDKYPADINMPEFQSFVGQGQQDQSHFNPHPCYLNTQLPGSTNVLQTSASSVRTDPQTYNPEQVMQSTQHKFINTRGIGVNNQSLENTDSVNNISDIADNLLDDILSTNEVSGTNNTMPFPFGIDKSPQGGSQNFPFEFPSKINTNNPIVPNSYGTNETSYVQDNSFTSQTYSEDVPLQPPTFVDHSHPRANIGLSRYNDERLSFQVENNTHIPHNVNSIQGQVPNSVQFSQDQTQQRLPFDRYPQGNQAFQTVNRHSSFQNRNFQLPAGNSLSKNNFRNMNKYNQNPSFQVPQNVNMPTSSLPNVRTTGYNQGSSFQQPVRGPNIQFQQTFPNTPIGSNWNSAFQQPNQKVNMPQGNCQKSIQNLRMLGSSANKSNNYAYQSGVNPGAHQFHPPHSNGSSGSVSSNQMPQRPFVGLCRACNRMFSSLIAFHQHKRMGQCTRS